MQTIFLCINREEIGTKLQMHCKVTLKRTTASCDVSNATINLDKAALTWFFHNNHCVRAYMPGVNLTGDATARTKSMTFLRVIFLPLPLLQGTH